MHDREKVIKGLSELEGFLFSEYGKVSADEANIWYDRFLLVSDALALLKEQEAVKPIPPERDENPLYRCGNCNYQLFRVAHEKYCPNCGKPILWEGR